MYDSSLISIADDRNCLAVSYSLVSFCFAAFAWSSKFLEAKRLVCSATKEFSRALGCFPAGAKSDGCRLPAVQIACCPPRGRGEAAAPEAPGSSGKQPRPRVGARLPAEAPARPQTPI